MPYIEQDDLVRLVSTHYMAIAAREHGPQGEQTLRALLSGIQRVYRSLEPETARGCITMFRQLVLQETTLDRSTATTITDPALLCQSAHSDLTLEVMDAGVFRLWQGFCPEVMALSENAVVYQYSSRSERFIVNRVVTEIPKIMPDAPSAFASPAFSELRTALREYGIKGIRYSSCPIFQGAWTDRMRRYFRRKPERIMRRSLWLFLYIRLRFDAEVHPEQPVDESHPVDIKVTWQDSNRLALIEIKWMGKSVADDGHVTADYSESRALEGAQQLATYLDENLVYSPDKATKGFLVVIDARRRCPADPMTCTDVSLGVHYRDRDVEYQPHYHEIRHDFEQPIRLFAEPACYNGQICSTIHSH